MPNIFVGEKIKNVRRSYNLSQSRFGTKIGVSGKTISAYETGRILPTLRIIEKIDEVFDKTIVANQLIEKETIVERIKNLEITLKRIEEALNRKLSL